jgi:hypothetical protein
MARKRPSPGADPVRVILSRLVARARSTRVRAWAQAMLDGDSRPNGRTAALTSAQPVSVTASGATSPGGRGDVRADRCCAPRPAVEDGAAGPHVR